MATNTVGTNKSQQTISRNRLLGVAGIGWLFDAMDVGILSFVIAALAADWGLTPSQAGWIGSINSIGMAVGALVFGVFADKIGRKQIFMWTLVLFSLASGLSAFTTTLTAFLMLRFLVGMGLGGELPVASTLVSESVAAKKRARSCFTGKLLGSWMANCRIDILFRYSNVGMASSAHLNSTPCILCYLS